VGPSGAPFSVQLDNNAAQNFSSYKLFYRPQMILFQASNLGGGQHTVTLTSTAWNNSALTLAVDYAQVYTTSSLEKKVSFFGCHVDIFVELTSFVGTQLWVRNLFSACEARHPN
jgi:hypothetical protein